MISAPARRMESKVSIMIRWRSIQPSLAPASMSENSPLTWYAAMGTSNRGYELRFRDRVKVGLVRGDMAGLDEFMEALRAELGGRWAEVTAPE